MSVFQHASTVAPLVVATAVQQITIPASNRPRAGRFTNKGTANIAWDYGTVAGLTMSNGVIMPPNTAETFLIPGGITKISVIGDGAGSSLSISLGELT